MKKEEFNLKTKVIQKTFNDNRKIKYPTPHHMRTVDEGTYPGGDIFTTEDGDLIDLEFQMTDFDEDELVKYVELAEALYEKNRCHISIYIICPHETDVRVKECEIMSPADFTIKVACVEEDPCKIILKAIKHKVKNHELLNGDDLHALSMLQVMCRKEERNYYRREYFKIINKIS